MAKSNFNFQKHEKELARKKKNEEKRQRKLAKKLSQDLDTDKIATPSTED